MINFSRDLACEWQCKNHHVYTSKVSFKLFFICFVLLCLSLLFLYIRASREPCGVRFVDSVNFHIASFALSYRTRVFSSRSTKTVH